MWRPIKFIILTAILCASCPLLAQNKLLEEAHSPSVELSSALSNIDLGVIDVLDSTPNQASGTFEVTSNDKSIYDVWISVPDGNLDAVHQVYLAKNGKYALPLDVSLTGGVVSTNPAVNQSADRHNARPHSGNPMDGDHVAGSTVKEIYQVTLTENANLHHIYSEIPQGQYQLRLMVHVDLN